jgi:16S rRNA (guanine527-N7)-methyltransferase
MSPKKFSYDDFLQYTAVSRETYSRLEDYTQLLEKWQKTINLVGTMTLKEIWTRHIIDSTQLFSHILPSDKMVDLGSGAGFPGLVIAMMGNQNVTLVESDGRKVAFLREAARATKTKVDIIHKRVEATDLKDFSLIVARGFAPLATLLEIVGSTLKASHKMLLLKGKKFMSEIEQAHAAWSFEYRTFPSITDPEGVILSMRNFKKTEGL